MCLGNYRKGKKKISGIEDMEAQLETKLEKWQD